MLVLHIVYLENYIFLRDYEAVEKEKWRKQPDDNFEVSERYVRITKKQQPVIRILLLFCLYSLVKYLFTLFEIISR